MYEGIFVADRGTLIFLCVRYAWAFSIYLEAVAIIPQLYLMQKIGGCESLTGHYVAMLGLYIRHWHFYRQSGMCSGIIYPFYTHITIRACTYMFTLEFQLVIPYHNRHTHCPRVSPYVMSDLEMVYIQHGTVRDSHM